MLGETGRVRHGRSAWATTVIGIFRLLGLGRVQKSIVVGHGPVDLIPTRLVFVISYHNLAKLQSNLRAIGPQDDG